MTGINYVHGFCIYILFVYSVCCTEFTLCNVYIFGYFNCLQQCTCVGGVSTPDVQLYAGYDVKAERYHWRWLHKMAYI